MGTRIIEQWFKGWLGKPETERDRLLDQRLGELERTLGEWWQSLKFGPIPGAYLDLPMRVHTVGGIVPGFILPQDVVGLPSDVADPSQFFEARPLLVTAILPGGFPGDSLDLQIKFIDSATGQIFEILTEPLTVTGSAINVARAERRRDFAVEKFVSETIFLEVPTINSGSPEQLSVHFLVNQVATAER